MNKRSYLALLGFLLLWGLGLFMCGYIGGKRSADRWYAEHPRIEYRVSEGVLATYGDGFTAGRRSLEESLNQIPDQTVKTGKHATCCGFYIADHPIIDKCIYGGKLGEKKQP